MSDERQQPGADEFFCSSCGAVIKKAAEICPKCGVRVVSQSAMTATFNPRSYPPGYAPKNKVTAALLCVFLGILGVHRFYVGKIGTGILMLLTLGGFGIWWLIDLIIICCGNFTDSNGYLLAANTDAPVAAVRQSDSVPPSEFPKSNKATGMGIAAIIFGVFGIIFGWFPIIQYAALALSIGGIVLAAFGIKESGRTGQGQGVSIAGLVFCILATILSGFGVFVCTSAAVKTAKDTPATVQKLEDAANVLDDVSADIQDLKQSTDSLKSSAGSLNDLNKAVEGIKTLKQSTDALKNLGRSLKNLDADGISSSLEELQKASDALEKYNNN